MVHQLSLEAQNSVIENSCRDSTPSHYFFVMVVLACAIATYGLLANAPAVVIGAMMVSPLMGPILGGALSIAIGNNDLFKMALRTELIGGCTTIILAMLLTEFLPTSEITEEVVKCATPTLLDLIISLAAGAAGTYAICYRPIGATLPGVAIATALMPPLCSVGIGLAEHDLHVASKSLLLFLANITAINLSAMIMFRITGFSPAQNGIPGSDRNLQKSTQFRILFSIALLLLLCIPLGCFMKNTYHTAQREKTIKRNINDSLAIVAPGSELTSISSIKDNGRKIDIKGQFKTTSVIPPGDIRKIENKLEYELGKPVGLTADVVLIQKVDNKNSMDAFKEVIPREIVEKVQSPEETIEKVINEKFSLLPSESETILKDFSFRYNTESDHTYVVNLSIISIDPLNEPFVDALEKVLEDRLKRNVRVQVFRAASQESGSNKATEAASPEKSCQCMTYTE